MSNINTVQEKWFEELTYSPAKSIFRLNAPDDAPHVTLRIYESTEAAIPLQTVRLMHSGNERWTAEVAGDWSGCFYTFCVGRGECPGTFAKAVGVGGKRAAILDMRTTDPEGWAQDRRPPLENAVDMVVYEMHHRDFSIHPSRQSHYPGKFLALTEMQNLWYLQMLGVTAVQILPSYDFSTVDEKHPEVPQYNWGYDPLNYNVPEGSYSTDATNPATRIREFKQMVQALHRAGIRVILDVVYNHCQSIEESNFQRTWPDYYFRRDAQGGYANASGCGNETASERPLMQHYMVESVAYWAREYHVDGFRFDLMAIHDIHTMNLIREELNSIDPSITMHGEGWAASAPAIPEALCASKAHMAQMPGIGAFGDEMRDGLRGPFSDNGKGAFLAAVPGSEESVKYGIVGGIGHSEVDMSRVNYSHKPWATQPCQHISYVSCHDDMSLVDRLRSSIPGISDADVVRLSQLAQTFVLTSQGVPFLWAGEEAFRDKKGVHNSYCSPDSINEIDWSRLAQHPELFLYYRGIIDLRRQHKAFRMGSAALVRDHLHFLPSPECTIAFCLNGRAVADTWDCIVCLFNALPSAQEFLVPESSYTIVCHDGRVNPEGLFSWHGSRLAVPPRSALIMHGNHT